MKVLICSPYFPDPVDGASISTRSLVRCFRQRKVVTTICTHDFGWSVEDYARMDQRDLLVFRCWPRHPLGPAPGMIAFFARKLRSFDVIHFKGFFQIGTVLGAYLARRQGRPYLISPLGNAVPQWRARRAVSRGTAKYLFSHVLARWALKGAAQVICVSESEENDTRQFLKTNNLMWIPNGIEETARDRDVCRGILSERLRVPVNEKLFLYLGRLSQEKNLEFLLDAWDVAKGKGTPGTLVLAGGDKDKPGYREHLQKIVASLRYPASVLLPGPVTGDLKQALLQYSVCLLLPSCRESFGNVVLEALAAGIPVLTSIGTPWQCLIDSGLGQWLPWDQEVWAEAIMQVATGSGFSPPQEFSRRSRRWVAENYSWEKSADRYLEVYRRVSAGTHAT